MFEHYSDEPVYNVKAVAHQTGIAPATLRAWERRYGVPSPPRTDSGYRLYSERDVAIVRWLKSQIENGMSISQAVHLLRSLEAHATDGQTSEAAVERLLLESPASYQRLHDEVIAGATDFDEAHIEYVLAEAFSLFPLEDVCLNLIQPVLVTLGDKWRLGEINISVEHFATNIMRRKLLALMAASPPVSREERIVSGCAPGEYHELGILIISLFLRRRGYGVIYLGQNISALRFEEMLLKTQPDLLLLSASGLVAAANLLDVAEGLHRRFAQPGTAIAFGGRVFNALPKLRRRVPGLYVGDDAQAATHQVVELLADKAARSMPQASYAPVDAETLAAVDVVQRLRHEIIAATARLLESHAQHGLLHKQLFQAVEHVLQVIASALRFGEPDVLSNWTHWTWDALPPDGISGAQLRQITQALAEAMGSVLPSPERDRLQPYFQAIQKAFD